MLSFPSILSPLIEFRQIWQWCLSVINLVQNFTGSEIRLTYVICEVCIRGKVLVTTSLGLEVGMLLTSYSGLMCTREDATEGRCAESNLNSADAKLASRKLAPILLVVWVKVVRLTGNNFDGWGIFAHTHCSSKVIKAIYGYYHNLMDTFGKNIAL